MSAHLPGPGETSAPLGEGASVPVAETCAPVEDNAHSRPRVAFLFPGQGAKRVHETLRFVAGVPAGVLSSADSLTPDGASEKALREIGRARCEEAARAAEVPLDKLLQRPSLLDRTEVLQPVLAAVGLSIVEHLSRRGVTPDVVLGLSAGEIPALAAAGGVSIEQAISLCALRGRLMAREAARHPGAMVALATSDPAVVERSLAFGREAGALEIASHNGPDETTLTGDLAAVLRVLSKCEVQATRIPTSGAWHSSLMEGALSEWRSALDETSISPLHAAMVANRTGDVVPSGPDAPQAIRALLAEQLVRPVEFRRALSTVRARCDAVVMIGPGAVLRALWHRNVGASGRTVVDSSHVSSRRDAGLHPQERNAPEKHASLEDTEDERSLRATIRALRGHA